LINNNKTKVDFAIITAIKEEQNAVIKAFMFRQKDLIKIENREYWTREIETKSGKYNIAAAKTSDKSNIPAAVLTTYVISDFHPRAILLVGVAAGKKYKVRKGDIIIGQDIHYYERGKLTQNTPTVEPKRHSCDAELLSHISNLPSTAIPCCKTPSNTLKKPKVHIGVIACGEKVIENADFWNQLLNTDRNIIAIDMESYGSSEAIWESSNLTKYLVIKAIMDFGIPPKTDRWKPFAAKVAALYAKNFIKSEPIQLIKNEIIQNTLLQPLESDKKVLIEIEKGYILIQNEEEIKRYFIREKEEIKIVEKIERQYIYKRFTRQ
jgi:nucleoside phosphorylase